MKALLIFILLAVAPASYANDIMQDFDSLGGNDELLDQAAAVTSEKKIQIVQDRIVKREKRHEFSTAFTQNFGGDVYVNTKSTSLTYNYHVNPRWSVGLNYSYYFNELSSEGDNLIKTNNLVPEIDWMKDSYALNFSWYPIYGKFNLLDKAIVHFDFYPSFGYGQANLKSGATDLFTAGLGMAFWLSQHLVSRLEYNYQSYTAQRFDGEDDIDATMATVSIGYLL